jgi:hypothetical protein
MVLKAPGSVISKPLRQSQPRKHITAGTKKRAPCQPLPLQMAPSPASSPGRRSFIIGLQLSYCRWITSSSLKLENGNKIIHRGGDLRTHPTRETGLHLLIRWKVGSRMGAIIIRGPLRVRPGYITYLRLSKINISFKLKEVDRIRWTSLSGKSSNCRNRSFPGKASRILRSLRESLFLQAFKKLL